MAANQWEGIEDHCEHIADEIEAEVVAEAKRSWAIRYGGGMTMMIEIQIKREVFRFTSHPRWVNKAAGWFAEYEQGTRRRMICVDALNRVCHNGSGFDRAMDDEAFPVVVYETL